MYDANQQNLNRVFYGQQNRRQPVVQTMLGGQSQNTAFASMPSAQADMDKRYQFGQVPQLLIAGGQSPNSSNYLLPKEDKMCIDKWPCCPKSFSPSAKCLLFLGVIFGLFILISVPLGLIPLYLQRNNPTDAYGIQVENAFEIEEPNVRRILETEPLKRSTRDSDDLNDFTKSIDLQLNKRFRNNFGPEVSDISNITLIPSENNTIIVGFTINTQPISRVIANSIRISIINALGADKILSGIENPTPELPEPKRGKFKVNIPESLTKISVSDKQESLINSNPTTAIILDFDNDENKEPIVGIIEKITETESTIKITPTTIKIKILNDQQEKQETILNPPIRPPFRPQNPVESFIDGPPFVDNSPGSINRPPQRPPQLPNQPSQVPNIPQQPFGPLDPQGSKAPPFIPQQPLRPQEQPLLNPNFDPTDNQVVNQVPPNLNNQGGPRPPINSDIQAANRPIPPPNFNNQFEPSGPNRDSPRPQNNVRPEIEDKLNEDDDDLSIIEV